MSSDRHPGEVQTVTLFKGRLKKYIADDTVRRVKWIPVVWKLASDGVIEEVPGLCFSELPRRCKSLVSIQIGDRTKTLIKLQCGRLSTKTLIDLEHCYLEKPHRKTSPYRSRGTRLGITLRQKQNQKQCSYYIVASKELREEWLDQLVHFCTKLPKRSKISLEDEDQETVEIGKGGFGVVYRWKQPESGNLTALKVQDVPAEDLEWESSVLESLQSVDGFPKLHQCTTGSLGWLTNKRYMVTEYVGPDLESLVDLNGPLAPKLLAQLAEKLLDSLAAMHDLGFIHHDLKPANICLRESTVDPVIIDFGLTIKFNKDWNFVKRRDSFDGTFMYTSIRNHLRQPQSFRDDVESLLYTLMTVSVDNIPWYEPRPANSSDKEAINRRERKIRDKKIRLPFHSTTPRGVSYSLITCFETVYTEKPPISNIKSALLSEWDPAVSFKYRPGDPKLHWNIETVDQTRKTTNPLREAASDLVKYHKVSCPYSEEDLEFLCLSQEPSRELQRELAEATHKPDKVRRILANVLWQQQQFLQRKIGRKLRKASSQSSSSRNVRNSAITDGAGETESERNTDVSSTSVASEKEQTKVVFLRKLLLQLELPMRSEFPCFADELCRSISFTQAAEHQELKTHLRAVCLDLWQQIEAYVSVIAKVCHEKPKHTTPEFLRHLQDIAQFVADVYDVGKVEKKIDNAKQLLIGKRRELETAKERLYWDCDGNRLCDTESRKGPEGLLLSKVVIYFGDLIRICEDFILGTASEDYLNILEKVTAFFEGICPSTPVAMGMKSDALPRKPEALSAATKELLDGLEETYEALFGLRIPRVFVRIYRRYMKELMSNKAALLSNMEEAYATMMKLARLLFELRKFELVIKQIRKETTKSDKKAALQKCVASYFCWPAYRYFWTEVGLFTYKMNCDYLDEVLIPALGTVSS